MFPDMFDSNVSTEQPPVEDNTHNAPPLPGNGHSYPLLEQHETQHDCPAQFYIKAHLLYPFLRGCELPGYPTDQHHDSMSIHADSSFRILTQDLLQFLKYDAFTEETAFTGGDDIPAKQNGTPYCDSWLIPDVELYHFLQSCADPASELPSSDNSHKIPTEQDDMLALAPSLLIPGERLSSFLQMYEISAFIVYPCPLCEHTFRRWQERDRHLESYLPHSVYCPLEDCAWTGRRRWDFKEHWKRKHSDAGRAPEEDATEIYDPNDFVESILHGTPVEEVARSAFAKTQERLGSIGKLELGANVLGRNRELRGWVNTSSSQLD